MHLSTLLQAAACLGDGELSLRGSCDSAGSRNQFHSSPVDIKQRNTTPHNRALSDSNSRYQDGHPKSMRAVFKKDNQDKRESDATIVTHSCGKAKKEEKFKFSCRLCDDFQPTTRCFNAERHIWVQHVRQQYPGQGKTLYEPFSAKHVVTPYIRTTTPEGVEVENREVAVLAALVASVSSGDSAKCNKIKPVVKAETIRLGRKYRRNGKLNPDEVLPSRRLKPYDSAQGGYSSGGEDKGSARPMLKTQISMPELSSHAALTKTSSSSHSSPISPINPGMPGSHDAIARRHSFAAGVTHVGSPSSAVSETDASWHRHSLPHHGFQQQPSQWQLSSNVYSDIAQRQKSSLIWTPVPELASKQDDDNIRPDLPLRRAISVMEHRSHSLHTPDIPEESEPYFAPAAQHTSHPGTGPATSPAFPAVHQASMKVGKDVVVDAAAPQSPLRRQSATMIAPSLVRPASAFGIRANDPPHPVWSQYGAPAPRAYYMS